ncbi:MAG: STAS domain-containing protein [Lentisphaeria bacterium]|nr:STAS domain-containing protein [Lentisphaeria bacterium]
MEIKKNLENGKLTIRPTGRIDTVTAPELAAAFTLDGVREVVFDLTDVDYISSAGLRIFLATHQKMAAAGGAMILTGVRPIVREIFDIVGFSEVFTFA